MSQTPIYLNVLGIDIAFKSSMDVDRAKSAIELLEKRYEDQKTKSRGVQSRDILLTFLALGLADELIRMKARENEVQQRLTSLLAKIEKSL